MREYDIGFPVFFLLRKFCGDDCRLDASRFLLPVNQFYACWASGRRWKTWRKASSANLCDIIQKSNFFFLLWLISIWSPICDRWLRNWHILLKNFLISLNLILLIIFPSKIFLIFIYSHSKSISFHFMKCSYLKQTKVGKKLYSKFISV